MLVNLSIRDFVIVDRLELDFHQGFTVLTGETGAGKSILIDALGLVLGGRADSGMVRAGFERAEISAEFDPAAMPEVVAWLQANELEDESGACLLRRVLDANGRSRGFINGRAATVQQLRELGEWLVDIHGQHAHHSLLRPEHQRALLDSQGGLTGLAQQVGAAFREWRDARQKRDRWLENAEAYRAECEQLDWQIQEVSQLEFSLPEWSELQAEHVRLANAANLIGGVAEAMDALTESDFAVLPQVTTLTGRLRSLAEYDPALNEVLEILSSAEIQIQEAGYTLRHYQQRLEADPERLAHCERRIEDILAAARKFRTVPEELPSLLEQWTARRAELAIDGEADALDAREQQARQHYEKLARALSKARQDAAGTFSREVTAAMQQLAMKGGRFEVRLSPSEPGPHGVEQIEFVVAGHEGQTAGPLAKVASGGELSRISLAIQVVASQAASVPTLIFDEVDVGIGGGVAEIVGQLLKRLGLARQVLCITHLPQVAALGDRHWRVAKEMVDGAACSRIEVLTPAERVDEIARMLGGVDITATTRAHASEMLAAGS